MNSIPSIYLREEWQLNQIKLFKPSQLELSAEKKNSLIKSKLLRNWQFQVFLLPILVLYTTFTIFPLFKSFYYSFTNFNGYNKNFDFIGLKNYIDLFKDDAIVSSISFTILFALLSTILVTVFAIPLAILLDQKFFGKNLQKAIFFFPSIPSALLLGYIWSFILAPVSSGVLNSFLGKLFHIQAIPWLSDPIFAKISTLIVTVWSSTGWHAVLYLAFLQAIPKDYYEAAIIDGASRLQQFKHITLPLLAPAMTVSVMLLLTSGLKVFDLPFALTKGGPGFSTYTITQVIMLRGVTELKYGLASAMSIVFFLIVALIAFLQTRLMQKREDSIQ
jgi:raffinose/stachyose/melibiose transport system permease protein